VEHTKAAINELNGLLDRKLPLYTRLDESNPALELAKKIFGKIVVIYSSTDRLDSVNLRWRCQIQENAKHLAFGNLLPEMNHNEINSWNNPEGFGKNMVIIFLRDNEDNPRIKVRFDALAEVLSPLCSNIISVESSAETLLARMFDLIWLGDWVSFYLAMLNGEDPTPIPAISTLKEKLSK